MRLLQKSENFILLLNGFPLILGHTRAFFAYMNTMTVSGKLFIWFSSSTDSAIVTHDDNLRVGLTRS
jgi:hypothetical protein